MGFYNCPDGTFYDKYGYFFDKDGFDEFGGRYDSDNNYVPPPDDNQEGDSYESSSSDKKDELLEQFEKE